MLVPIFLPNVPRDFLAPDNGALKYQNVDGTYLLYSVGIDGIDGGGVIAESPDGYRDPLHGDLLLKGHFTDAAGP